MEGEGRKKRDAANDSLIGATLAGRYRVLRRIAEGGMGAVYEGEQLAIGRKVAIKCLHAHLAKDEDIVGRFRREALATTAIGHPHIVEVLDLGEMDDGSLFMVLELLAGRDLARVLKDEGPLPIGRAARILAQVCEGVGAAHAKGIVHRDLKPENVFLIERAGDPDFVKVLDFGVSKIRDQLEGEGDRSKTKTGTALGTPYYMAPEQAQGRRDVDHRADVYALGVILFRMLTGHHPFDDESYPMLVLKICTEPPPRATTWRSDLPGELITLLDRMLAKDAAERPESVDAVRAELERLRGLDAAPALTGAPGPARAAPGVLARSRDHSPAAHARTQAATPALRTSHREDDDDDELAEAASKVVPPSRTNPIVLLGIGALALATIAVVAYATMQGGPDAPDEPEEVALPTPREPVIRAFAAAPAGAGDGGWSWINPRPRAMPTWYAVAVGGPGLVAMVGQDGAAARFLGGSLVTWRTGTRSSLRALAWTSQEDAIAVGEEGTIVRLTTRGPHAVESGLSATLRAVSVLSPTEVLVAGDAGTLAILRGTALRRVDAGTDAALLAIHERGDATWIVGEGGTILRMAGGVAREESGTGVVLRAVGGCERGDLYAAGDQATLVRHRSDGTWQNVRTDVDPGEAFTSIACDHGHAVIVGTQGTVLLASGQRTVRLASGTDRPFHGVSGARDEATWIVGAGGRLATLEEDHVETRTAGPTVPLRDVGAIGGAIVAVGEWGRIVREQEHGFEESESPTDAGLAALAPLDESRLIAVGDLGAIVEVTWQGARLLPSPTDASLRDVIVASDGRVLAVGTGGTLLRGGAESLAASRVPDVGDLWALAGTPDDAIAVGDGATVVHVTAGGAARWPCDVGGASLRAIASTPAGPIAVGEGGVIVRVAEGGCTEEHRGGATLDAIAIGPDGRALAVGESGTAWTRGDDGAWTESELELGGNHARAARRIGRHLYVVGTGGSIVRHIVTDGT